ncbi:MAG TPA: ABC transporter permease [Opitutaceae bacterium]|nr:ABC transporter permease [Opitutaceae bacterium]
MSFLRRLNFLLRRRRAETDMADEMRFHLEQRAARLRAEGLSEAEARLAAQRRFGNTASIQEHSREALGLGALERAVKDVRFAFRQLARSPGFSLLAIVTLGLGIGANTAMFSVLNGLLLKPLPYPGLDRLERIYRTTGQNPLGGTSAPDFLALRAAKEPYGDVAAYLPVHVSLSRPGEPADMAYSARVSANLLRLLGVGVHLGRDFRDAEDTAGQERVVILSHRVWQNRFGARPDIVGQTVRVDGLPHEVVGVLPSSFNDWRHLGAIDFLRPLALTRAESTNRAVNALRVIGRRHEHVSAEAAAGFVAAFGARLAADFPEANAGSAWRAVALQDTAGGGGELVLPMLVCLSGFVLLIACSNLANLLLARTMARAREFAVRSALGASRLQLLRPLVAESLLLSLAGGGCAILSAHWFRDWAAMRSTGDNGEQVVFAVDWHVLGWAFLASLGTAVAFGVAPALFALRLDLNHALKSGGRGSTGGRGHHRFRQALIVGQFALAMVLLSGAALFIRGLDDLHHRRSGWESSSLVTGNMVLPAGTYGDDQKIAAFHRLALERLRAVPGAKSASLSAATPFFHWSDVRRFVVDGQERPAPGREPAAMVNAISPDYLATYGHRLVAGRDIDSRDQLGSARVCLLGESTARALFGEPHPLGRRLAVAAEGAPAWIEVVGIVSDFQTVDPDPNPVVHHVYLPLAQSPVRHVELAVRAAGVPPSALVDPVRATIAGLDADLPVRRLQPADATIDRTLYQLRVLRDLLAGLGVLGLGLASLGVYGVVARTTAQRSGEFAIRLALGACVADITRLVLGTGVRQALIGSALGLAGAAAVSAIIGASFPGIRTNSVAVLAATALGLVAVALLACWLPARRAGRIDAMAALRAE